MSVETIERDFKAKVSDRIRLMSEGMDRYQVFTPFVFDDGIISLSCSSVRTLIGCFRTRGTPTCT